MTILVIAVLLAGLVAQQCIVLALINRLLNLKGVEPIRVGRPSEDKPEQVKPQPTWSYPVTG